MNKIGGIIRLILFIIAIVVLVAIGNYIKKLNSTCPRVTTGGYCKPTPDVIQLNS